MKDNLLLAFCVICIFLIIIIVKGEHASFSWKREIEIPKKTKPKPPTTDEKKEEKKKDMAKLGERLTEEMEDFGFGFAPPNFRVPKNKRTVLSSLDLPLEIYKIYKQYLVDQNKQSACTKIKKYLEASQLFMDTEELTAKVINKKYTLYSGLLNFLAPKCDLDKEIQVYFFNRNFDIKIPTMGDNK